MQDQDYGTDLSLWAESRARALRDAGRAGTNLPIDWENVAEEIEAFGRLQARELVSRIRTILVHLLKLQASPATEPRAGWRETIAEQRVEIERVLEDSPSLRQRIGQVIAKELEPARRQVLLALAGYEETARVDVAHISYAEAEVLGTGFLTECGCGTLSGASRLPLPQAGEAKISTPRDDYLVGRGGVCV